MGRTYSAVTVGDLNGDALLDILITDAVDNTVSVLLGYGNGSFANPMTYSTGKRPSSVTIGDLNNDSKLDIVVANLDGNTVSVLLGYGNGSFARQKRYSTGGRPVFVTVADFNNDQRLDLVVANQNDNNIGVFLGHGNGSFATQRIYSTGVEPSSVAVADFNNDTHLDIVVGGAFGFLNGNVCIFFGKPDKVFQREMTLKTDNRSQPRAFAIADFNNDTHLDIATANSGTNNIGIFLGFGNLSFTEPSTYSTGSSPWSIAAGDVNNDGSMDLVVVNFDDNNVSVLLGHGNGSFSNQTKYSTGVDSQPRSVSLADFDNDGLLDIIVVNYVANTVVIFFGHGDGTFEERREFLIGYDHHPFLIAHGDFNGDNKLDFAVANDGVDNMQIMLQTC